MQSTPLSLVQQLRTGGHLLLTYLFDLHLVVHLVYNLLFFIWNRNFYITRYVWSPQICSFGASLLMLDPTDVGKGGLLQTCLFMLREISCCSSSPVTTFTIPSDFCLSWVGRITGPSSRTFFPTLTSLQPSKSYIIGDRKE